MSTRCLGGRAHSLLSQVFRRQLGLGSSFTAEWRRPKPLTCTQILDRQTGAQLQHSQRASQPPSRLQRHIASRGSPAHATAPMTKPAEAVAATPAADADNGTAPAAEAAAAGTADSSATYEQQLTGKVVHVRQLFSDFELPELEIHRSSPDHYRLRCLPPHSPAEHILLSSCHARQIAFAW